MSGRPISGARFASGGRRGDRVPVVLQEPEDVERRGDDAELAAVVDDLPLVRLAESAGGPISSASPATAIRRRSSSPGTRPRSSLSSSSASRRSSRVSASNVSVQPARLDLVAQLEHALALLGEQRIAEDDVRPPILVAQPLHLVDDVRDRARAIAGEDPVRAIGAELRAAAAGEQRIAAADRTRRPLDARASRDPR